jgi:hypothetical protein
MQRTDRPWIVLGLIAFGVASRLAPHPPNTTPLAAIALFGGVYLSRRWAVLLPLAAVMISDIFLPWDATVPFNWAAFALTGVLAWWVRAHPSAARIGVGAVAASLLFFVITNAGVWVGGQLYPRTLTGLGQCFAAAVPFFRNTLAGDLFFTALLFGSHAVLTKAIAARQPARAP